MERGSITKWLLFGLAIFLIMTSGRKAFFGSKPSELQPWGGIVDETSAPEGNIVETAVAAGQFKTLTSLLQQTGLDKTLAESGPYTVFAPTDEAFAKVP